MKISYVFLLVPSVFFLLFSCEKVEELLTIKVPISTFSIEIKDIMVGESNEDLNPFGVVQIVGVNSIDGLGEVGRKHLSHITKIESGSGSITITSDDGSGSVVESFVLGLDGLNSDLYIDQSTLGVAYTDESTNDYLNKLMMKILLDGNLNIRVSGKTDASTGKTLKARIKLENVVLHAKLIN